MKKTALIFGGPSGEHEVSINSAENIAANLVSTRYDVHKIYIHKNGKWQFFPNDELVDLPGAIAYLAAANFDIAIIAVHGEFGEDGQLQAILDNIRLPYVGSGMTASAVSMDKNISNILYEKAGLAVPGYDVFGKADVQYASLPIVIKPVRGGSSVGTTVVRDKKMLECAINEAFEHDSKIIAQEYIAGREFTCGVIEKENGENFALPPTEIIPQVNIFFDYKAKYSTGGSKEVTPPDLPQENIKELQDLAIKAHVLLGCRGISRSDFIFGNDKWYILETNTLPGMTRTSLVPQEAKAAGIELPQLMDILIQSALNK